LDGWLHTLGLQEFGLSIRLVKASELPENACSMSRYDVQSGIGEIDVLRRVVRYINGVRWTSGSRVARSRGRSQGQTDDFSYLIAFGCEAEWPATTTVSLIRMYLHQVSFRSILY
jgi:hypothetical protein